jgi:hypothetical protein
MAQLTDSAIVKLKFVTMGISGRYEGIHAAILNPNKGKVDDAIFRFADIIGMKPANIPDSHIVAPSFDGNDRGVEWYLYKPTPQDYEKIAGVIGDYFEMFREAEERQYKRDHSR